MKSIRCHTCGRYNGKVPVVQIADPEVLAFIEKLAQRKDLEMWGQKQLGFQNYNLALEERKRKPVLSLIFKRAWREIRSFKNV